MTAPRIAYLFARYPIPSQTFCDTEMLALEALGLELEIDATSPPKQSFRHERLSRLRAEVHHLPPPRIVRVHALRAERDGRWPGSAVADYASRYGEDAGARTLARQALVLAAGLESRGVAHVHAHFASHAAKVALMLKRVAGFPFSMTAHAQDFMLDLGSDELLREICREAEFVVAVSDWSRERLRATCPESADKIVRVYNGIDPEEFPEQAALPERARPRIVDVARLIEFKGHHFLVDACAELQRRGVEFECTIVGEGPWREPLEARIRAAGLGERVFLGGLRTQDEVKRLLLDADVFALPSIVDAQGACDVLPTVILEAMASGLPVVSTRLAGVPELVEDGATGLLAEPRDPIGLADALARLLASRELRRSFGEAGRKRLEERFASARSAPALAERFLASAARSPRRRQGAEPRASFAWLAGAWPPRPGDGLARELDALAHRHPEAPILAFELDPRFEPTARGVDLGLSARIEFLPDGIVLEAGWLADAAGRAEIDGLRERVPGFFSGEAFYRDARRALWIADALRRRGIRHLHAARAGGLLCAWLVKQLVGVRVSFALERRGAASRRAYARLCRDLDFGAVSDDLLFETLRDECGAALPLVTPLPRPRGAPPALPPLRPLRGWLRRAQGPNLERGISFEAWLERIAASGRAGADA